MAFIIKDRVKEGTTSTGTGAVTLGGAVATFDTFQSYMTNGDTTYYAIVHTTSGVDEWEVGLGTWNTGNTLTRTTVLAGSNGASAQDFSAGTKDVFMTYPAAHAALAEDDVTFANITVTGTVDGRDVAADGTKLDGIDTSADVTDATTVAAAGALMKSGGTMTGALILSADPSAALGAATKEYVDTIASSGIHYHDPVRVEHPSNINATYNNGSSGVGATLTNAGSNAAIQLDGVSLALNDRVLVSNQTNEAHNGVYKVTTVGDGSTAWVLTRTVDADSYAPSDPDAFGKGDAFFIKEGDTNAGHLDVLTTAGTITFGTTNIHFAEVAETAVYSAGTGITLTGDVFSIGQSVGTSDSVTFSQVTAAIIGNVTGNVTGDVTGNAATATALATARTIQLTGDVTGSATFDGSANASITATVQDDSHSHVISNVDGLQTALDSKTDETRTITAGNGLTGGGNLTANRTISHADTSTVSDVNGSGNTFIQDIGFDTYGHVTSVGTGTVTVGDGAMTVTAGSGLTGGGQVGTANQSGASSVTVSHADTSSQASVNNSNGTVIQDITLDTYGHITGIASTNLDGRYYTESEADSRFVNVTGDNMTGVIRITANQEYDNVAGLAPSNVGQIRLASGNNGMSIGLDDDTNSRMGWIQVGHESNTYSSSAVQGSLNLNPHGGSVYVNNSPVFHAGYHPNADKWTTSRTLSLTGDVTGSVSWDGSGNASLSTTTSSAVNKFRGDITSQNWNSYIDGTETGYYSVVNATGSNKPPTYEYGLAVNWAKSGQGKLQLYAPHNGSDGGNGLWFRSGWNTDYDAWSEIWHSRNDGSGSGLDADLLDGYHSAENGGSVNLRTASNGYLQIRNWVDVGSSGIFSSTTNSAHFYPNTSSSYGTWRVGGSRNGYTGFLFDHAGGASNSGVHIMYDAAGNGGAWKNAWHYYFHEGNNCLGVAASATSSTYELYVSGDIYATGNITAYSDERKKENIETIDGALDMVTRMRGVRYNKIGNPVDDKEVGVIAQEMQEVCPESVVYAEDVDEYGVRYGNLVGVLIEAIKEQQTQIDELKAKLGV